MTFYLLSECLTCGGVISGVYDSLKILSRKEKGLDIDTLAAVLEFWIVLAAAAIYQQYIEFFISWFPLYFFLKCLLLGLLLTPNRHFRHVFLEGFIRPFVELVKLKLDTNVLPVIESLVIQHGHWFNNRLLARSIELSSVEELFKLEQNLKDKLLQVQDEIYTRQRANSLKSLQDITEALLHTE
ncbi:TB2/DP1/HVA22-related protein [Plasmopara halstedii]|uniref:TB2/DP1/HVA22-related protein n=1 Tax=Plasmopara halstedii TaxID=4781 RepID=A0A0P1B4Y4_PLAHL|nr:TB2/DP1/HVA22-related protein [Plasmopara halstedii]CEG49037.1 TB2/DP1/HVA22-related protein [Plasmopara halstedii]|eukprot:XP_024585406.1 TB2/DP1/HVA22-related protein [Plasmopara halstedii]